MAQPLFFASCVCNVVFPALAVTSLALTRQLSRKFLLLGLVQYALTRVILSVATAGIRLLEIGEFGSTVVRAVLLAGVCVWAKILVYRHVFDVSTMGEAASAGLGEGLAEVFFVTSPNALNRAAYSLAISDGTLAERLGPSYSPEMVKVLATSFQEGGASLAVFGGLSCLLVISVQVSVARLIGRGGGGVALASFVAYLSYGALYVLPSLGYLVADVVIATIVAGLFVLELAISRLPQERALPSWQL